MIDRRPLFATLAIVVSGPRSNRFGKLVVCCVGWAVRGDDRFCAIFFFRGETRPLGGTESQRACLGKFAWGPCLPTCKITYGRLQRIFGWRPVFAALLDTRRRLALMVRCTRPQPKWLPGFLFIDLGVWPNSVECLVTGAIYQPCCPWYWVGVFVMFSTLGFLRRPVSQNRLQSDRAGFAVVLVFVVFLRV